MAKAEDQSSAGFVSPNLDSGPTGYGGAMQRVPMVRQTQSPHVRRRDTRWRERGGRSRRLPRAAPISEYTRIRVSDAIDRPVFDVLYIASVHHHLAVSGCAPPPCGVIGQLHRADLLPFHGIEGAGP